MLMINTLRLISDVEKEHHHRNGKHQKGSNPPFPGKREDSDRKRLVNSCYVELFRLCLRQQGSHRAATRNPDDFPPCAYSSPQADLFTGQT